MFGSELSQKREYELISIFAAVLGSIAELCFQKISCQPVVTDDGVISMSLVMEVKPFSFLLSRGRKQGRVKIKQHMLRLFDRVDDISYLRFDQIELLKSVFIHPVMEPGDGRLESKGTLIEDCPENRVLSQLIRTVIFKV